MGLPTSGTNCSVSTLSPSSSGRLQPLAMASSAASGAGILAAGLGQHLSAGHGEGERLLLLAQADRLLFALARSSSSRPDCCAQCEQPQRLVLQLLRRHGVEDEADLPGAVGLGGFAGADHLGGQRRADEPRQPLRAAPAGDEADLRLRAGRSRSSDACRPGDNRSPAPAPVRRPCRRRRWRRRWDTAAPRSDAMRSRPRFTSLRASVRIGLGAAQLLQVGAGDEHAGFAAAEDQAAHVAARLAAVPPSLPVRRARPGRACWPGCRADRTSAGRCRRRGFPAGERAAREASWSRPFVCSCRDRRTRV